MSEQAQQQYQQISQQIGQLRQKISELEGEKYEHDLVIKTLEPMADDRKCFRLIGGVLVERPKKEAESAVKNNLEQVILLIERFQAELIDLEKTAIDFRNAHGLAAAQAKQAEESLAEEEDSKKPAGILA
jgi:prefoldin subunit 2